MPKLGEFIPHSEKDLDNESYTCPLCKVRRPSQAFKKRKTTDGKGYYRESGHCQSCPAQPNAPTRVKRPSLSGLQNQINNLQEENIRIKTILETLVTHFSQGSDYVSSSQKESKLKLSELQSTIGELQGEVLGSMLDRDSSESSG